MECAPVFYSSLQPMNTQMSFYQYQPNQPATKLVPENLQHFVFLSLTLEQKHTPKNALSLHACQSDVSQKHLWCVEYPACLLILFPKEFSAPNLYSATPFHTFHHKIQAQPIALKRRRLSLLFVLSYRESARN